MSEKLTMRTVLAFLIGATLLSVLVFLIFPSVALYCFAGLTPRNAVLTGIGFWIVVWAVTFVVLRSRKKS
jgi:type VI protein secretion system component VasK